MKFDDSGKSKKEYKIYSGTDNESDQDIEFKVKEKPSYLKE